MPSRAAPSAPYRPLRPCLRESAQIRHLSHCVYRWGGAGDPLILLHGWGDSGETYQFLVDHLAPERTCVAPDWRGFGRTQWPQEGYWFADYLADLDAMLEHFCPGKPVDIVGHSMGGNVAMLYAGIRPERVRRLIDLEGFGLPPATAEEAVGRYREWLDQVSREATPYAEHATFERFEWLLRKRNPRIPAERIAFIARSWAQEVAPGRVVLRADPRHRRRNPVLYRLEEAEACWRAITARVLLVMGDRSELAGSGGLARLEASVRDARVEVVAGAGHMLHHEQPEKLARVIENFLSA